MKTLLLGVLRTLEGSDKPTIALHVKAHGSTPVQVCFKCSCAHFPAEAGAKEFKVPMCCRVLTGVCAHAEASRNQAAGIH